MTLGEAMETITSSDRIMILNAARQVVYRGYAASATHARLNPTRKVERIGLGMETYKKTEKMWDWATSEPLAAQIPVEQFSQFSVGELEHIIYIKIVLANEYMS